LALRKEQDILLYEIVGTYCLAAIFFIIENGNRMLQLSHLNALSR
jgi:hypothetical protein